MSLSELKKQVYSFFDEKMKPLIEEGGPTEEVVKNCYVESAKFPTNLKWIVRTYGDTVRVSAYSYGFGYQFFMIATQDGCEEYPFGATYYGSRKRHENSNSQ